MPFQRTFTKEQALQKARHYCAYQERCHQEVKEKLYSFGLYKQDVETLLSQLIEEDYLNEERFAIQFAGGKFRMKQWGRVKITYELKQKRVSPYCIKKALKAIDEQEYQDCLQRLTEKKWNSVSGPGVNKFVKLSKTTDHLLQKGFENDLVRAAVQQVSKGEVG